MSFFERSSEGLVRYLNCVAHHTEQPIHNQIKEWKVVSDNAAIDVKKQVVYKIFDNRFQPTYRRPNQWWNKKEYPWIQKLEVEQYFYINEESEHHDALGHPPTPTSGHKRKRGVMHHTTYPRGSVLVIKYRCVNGTHFASEAAHFLQIADCIKEMHALGVVHGDIRGFNMLHPHPEDRSVKDGISESLLIDFDLSGSAETDKYPPGYSQTVPDNFFPRSGSADKIMKKSDDWKDLGSVMSWYVVQPYENMTSLQEFQKYKNDRETWSRICDQFCEGHGGAYNSLKQFVENNPPKIGMSHRTRKLLNDTVSYKGTGSPTKTFHKPRGSSITTEN